MYQYRLNIHLFHFYVFYSLSGIFADNGTRLSSSLTHYVVPDCQVSCATKCKQIGTFAAEPHFSLCTTIII